MLAYAVSCMQICKTSRSLLIEESRDFVSVRDRERRERASLLKSGQPFLPDLENVQGSRRISIQCESRRGCGTARSRRTEVAVVEGQGGGRKGLHEAIEKR